MKKESLQRRIIHFSRYSYCVTLPKTIMNKFGWQAGQPLVTAIDEVKKTITLGSPIKPPKNKQVRDKKKTRW